MTDTELHRLYESNFLEYASYVIKDRAIPDAADGLKPVQRRIFWSLHEMEDGRFNKVANVIGNTMKYHPHGDQSIGNALVSLANRSYFIETQGNFGNILTGDDSSAPRYIECRLSELAKLIFFNKDLTSFTDSYDGRNTEPVCLPAKLPVLLLIGAEGIAVGMATKIMPHNFREVLEAQIKILKQQIFELFPDFLQGGILDVSGYSDGNGRIRIRAKIETRDDKRLVIKEVAYGSTTESLIASIEAAARKGRIKIASIDDFTTDQVEIQITLARGVHSEEGLKRLYAHTECEMPHSPNLVVIMEGKPIQTTVSDLLRYNTDLLLFYLEKELRLDLEKHREQLHWLTLEQIFIENRLYKNIEECSTWNDVVKTTENSLQPFLKKLPRKLMIEDIEKLLTLKIRRISRFDIEKNRSDIRKTKAAIRKTKSFLEDITGYTISFLEDLLGKYGEKYPRKTRIETFGGIKTQEVAIKNLRLSCDTEKGFIGTGVKGEVFLPVSEYDRTVIFFSNGVYKVIPVEDKVFVDTDVVHFDVYDRDHVFTSVYRQKNSRIAYIKRFTVGGFILGKEYSFFPEGDENLYFTGEQDIRLEYWFERKKRQKSHKGSTLLSDVRIGGAGAHGKRLAGTKVISSIKSISLTEEDKIEERSEVGEDSGGENSDSDDLPKNIEQESETEKEEEEDTASDTTTIENNISELAEEAIRQAEKVHRIVETIETSPREASPRKQDSEESDLFGDLEE